MNEPTSKADPPSAGSGFPQATLRKAVLSESGQDVLRCHGCGSCNIHSYHDELDLSLDSLVQLILQDDEEVLTCHTLWSDNVLHSIQFACQRGLDLRAILLALRQEAIRRNLKKGGDQ